MTWRKELGPAAPRLGQMLKYIALAFHVQCNWLDDPFGRLQCDGGYEMFVRTPVAREAVSPLSDGDRWLSSCNASLLSIEESSNALDVIVTVISTTALGHHLFNTLSVTFLGMQL